MTQQPDQTGASGGTGAKKAPRWQALRRHTIDVTSLRESRDWRLLFFGQAIGVAGDQMRIVAVPYLVYLITHSSFAVGLASLAQFVPTMFLAFAGGNLADRVDRRKVLLASQALLTLTLVALAVAALHGRPPLWLLFVLVAVAAGIDSFEQPARAAAVPRLIRREQFANAMALNQVTYQLGNVLGPALGGLLIARFGAGQAFAVNALASGVAVVALLFVATMPATAGEGSARKGIAAIREGFAYLKGKPVILSTFLIDFNAMLFGSPAAIMPALALQVFHTGPVGLGLLFAAPGAGALAGALLTGWVGRVRRQGLAVIIAVVVWGAATAAFGLLTGAFWLALGMLAIAGAADMFSAVFRGTILQMGVPDRLRGRLSALHFLVVTSGPRLGDLEAGSVAAVAGPQFSAVSGGVAAAIGAIVIALAIPAFACYDARTSLAALPKGSESVAP